MMARVRGVMAASIASGSISMVSSLISTNTGRAPVSEMASAVAMNVCATVMTSSPVADAECPKRQIERIGAVADAHCGIRLAIRRELCFEQPKFVAADERALGDGPLDGVIDVGLDRQILCVQVQERNFHR